MVAGVVANIPIHSQISIPALGIEPNGKTLDVAAVTVDRSRDRQRVRTVYLDLAAVYAQLGDDVASDEEWSA